MERWESRFRSAALRTDRVLVLFPGLYYDLGGLSPHTGAWRASFPRPLTAGQTEYANSLRPGLSL